VAKRALGLRRADGSLAQDPSDIRIIMFSFFFGGWGGH